MKEGMASEVKSTLNNRNLIWWSPPDEYAHYKGWKLEGYALPDWRFHGERITKMPACLLLDTVNSWKRYLFLSIVENIDWNMSNEE